MATSCIQLATWFGYLHGAFVGAVIGNFLVIGWYVVPYVINTMRKK